MVRQGVDMEKHLYVVVASVGECEIQTIEVEATGRVDAEFKFPSHGGTVYILAVYGPYERSNDVTK